MASVMCKAKKTGKPKYFACWVVIAHRAIDLTNSVADPVPLSDGEYDLLWELRGEYGNGVALEVWSNGTLVAQQEEQLIPVGQNRIGSGSRPGSIGYRPLRFKVGGRHA